MVVVVVVLLGTADGDRTVSLVLLKDDGVGKVVVVVALTGAMSEVGTIALV